MPAMAAPVSASTTRPRTVAVGARTTTDRLDRLSPDGAGSEPRPRSPPSATILPPSRGRPSRTNVPSARPSAQRPLTVPSKRTSAPGTGGRLSARTTVPLTTPPSSRTSGAAPPPETLSWYEGEGAATARANVPSGFVVAVAMGFGASPRRASRRAAGRGISRASASTLAPDTGFLSTRSRPRTSPAPAEPARRPRPAAIPAIAVRLVIGNLLAGRQYGRPPRVLD